MTKKHKKGWKSEALVALAALGVVFGDIGTSPLYAIKEINHHLGEAGRELPTVLGYISLVIWSLLIIITLKYVLLVLRADNEGEGGVFALFAFLNRIKAKGVAFVSFLLLLSVGFLLGDGIITPAISVISAVEGLGIITTAFEPYIVPITIAILFALFMIQKNGTAKIGKLFGPIIALWFVSLAVSGVMQIVHHPEILMAINPVHALRFVIAQDLHTLILVLGSVILVVTGGEALYADMGHFGIEPIRRSWFGLVFPSLVINYLGQGAFLLSDTPLINHNVFFSMVPGWALIPLVIIATLATIIASQALITGAFSLIAQGIALGYVPFLKVIHTHHDHVGQIYVPFVNYSLLVGCILLVLQFQSSTNLASAYGLAVSYVMVVTTMAVYYIAIHVWKWSTLKALAIFLPLGLIDFTFLAANSIKFFEGGYIPLVIGFLILFVMKVWHWGKQISRKKYQKYSSLTIKELLDLKQSSTSQIPKSFVIMTPFGPKHDRHKIALLGQVILDRYGLIPKHMIFVTVVNHQIPYYHQDRFNIFRFFDDPKKGSITSVRINYGFMEKRQVEKELVTLSKQTEIQLDKDEHNWLIHVTRERFFLAPGSDLLTTIKARFYQLLYKNSKSADEYFDLGKHTKLSIEVLPVQCNH